MQKALSLAVLLGAMLHLQGCGGGAETTNAPPVPDTTAAPSTTAAPTAAPKAARCSQFSRTREASQKRSGVLECFY